MLPCLCTDFAPKTERFFRLVPSEGSRYTKCIVLWKDQSMLCQLLINHAAMGRARFLLCTGFIIFFTFFFLSVKKVKSASSLLVAHTAGAYPGFRSIKRLGVFLLPPGWDASPSQGYPQQYFAGTHLYTWVERSTMRVKCLA